MDERGRRAFLTRLGALATAPVLTAFTTQGESRPGGSGLLVPERTIADPPAPLVISSLTAPPPDWRPGAPMRAPQGQLLVWIDGEPWRIAAWRA
jgi:hypothetical protein